MNEPTTTSKFLWKDFGHFMGLVMLREHCNKQPHPAEYTKALMDSWLERANAHIDEEAATEKASAIGRILGGASDDHFAKAKEEAKGIVDVAMKLINYK